MRVGELLRDAARRLDEAGSDTPRLDAEVLLGHVLGVDRATLLAEPEALVGDGAAHAYVTLLDRRATGEPVSYIRGIKEFYGLAFAVDARALIPRPETELLVDIALKRLETALSAAPRPPGMPPLSVLDIGTGSGAVAVALSVESRRRGWAGEVRFVATDVSADALAVAIENAVGHGVSDLISFKLADLADPEHAADIVTANLPYVPTEDISTLPVAARFEPTTALDGGADGLRIIARLVERLPHVVRSGGVALLEIGADQSSAMQEQVTGLAGWELTIHNDLSGRPRVAEIRRLV
jgi:release factor glutamine methyltransferase